MLCVIMRGSYTEYLDNCIHEFTEMIRSKSHFLLCNLMRERGLDHRKAIREGITD